MPRFKSRILDAAVLGVVPHCICPIRAPNADALIAAIAIVHSMKADRHG